MMLQAVKEDPCALQYASEELKGNAEIVLEVTTSHMRFWWLHMCL